MSKLNVDEYLNANRPNRVSAKIKPGFNSAKSGLLDNVQLSSMKQYQSETYEGKTEFFATVLRVKIRRGPDPNSPQITARCRVPELHSHLPMPKGPKDNKIIDLYPEFSGEKREDFSGLAPGQIVRVSHIDRHQTGIRYNNGRLLQMVGGQSTVAGFSQPENKNANGTTKRSRLEGLGTFVCPAPSTSVSPTKGLTMGSKNLEKKISDRNPRTLKRSMDEPNINDSIYSSGGCPPRTQPVGPDVLAPSSVNNPSPNAGASAPAGQNSNTAGISNLGGGLNSNSPNQKPEFISCEKVYSVKQTVIEIPPPPRAVRFTGTEIAKTWSPTVDRKILTLHPKMRPLVAYFVNTAYEHGYKLGIGSTYRSIAKQEKLRRARLVNPNGPITGKLKKGVPAVAVPGRSCHNYGLGVDFFEYPSPANGNKFSKMFCGNGYPLERWMEIGRMGLACGFESWGGNYGKPLKSGWDPVHFQCKYGKTTRQLKKLFDTGQVIRENGLIFPKI